MKRRYRFLRSHVGCDPITAAFVTVINAFSDLPPNKVGFMHVTWTMGGDE